MELAEWEEKYKTKLREHKRLTWKSGESGKSPRCVVPSTRNSPRAAANLRMLYGGWKAERDEKLAAKAAAAEEKAKGKKEGREGQG